MSRLKFNAKASLAMLDQMHAVLIELGNATLAQLVERVGKNAAQLGVYMDRLVELEKAHCAFRSARYRGKLMPNVWAPGPATSTDGRDDLPQRVVVCKSWPPHNVRDPLITAFFGPANNQ